MSDSKVAIITGGASGIGLAVAEVLSQRGWRIHIFDLHEANKDGTDAHLTNCVFHNVDVASWSSLSSSFDAIFKAEVRLDFVFANAGVMENEEFFERHDLSLPPPEPEELSIDVNLRGVVRTSYLAQHYFRANANGGKDCVLIMTSSIAGIYSQAITPLYAASKAGIINFMRSVAPVFHNDGIRTYTICPGSVRTNLLPQELWDAYPQEFLTSMNMVTLVVELLVDGTAFEDSRGEKFDKSLVGLAVEIFVNDIYFREPPEPCNEGMGFILEYMRPENRETAGESGG